MTVAELLGKILAPDSPWLLVLAVVILAAAAGLGRRLFASQQRIGARVGAVEKLAGSEQTRRRQIEAVLLELGVPLPIWPDDPVNVRELAFLRRRVALADRGRDDEDQDHEQDREFPITAERPAPPVPPFAPAERARMAAHRR